MCGRNPSATIDGSVTWRGAALARRRQPRDIFLDVCMTGNLFKQAAPGNVLQRVRFVDTSRVEQSSNGMMNKTARAVVSGSRLFNTVFGLPRNAENITRSLGTFQSGSPPGQATIDSRGTKKPRFWEAAY